MSVVFSMDVQISFGHCDPAGIVFYPNYFRWFDRCFHTFLLRRGGGHRAVCDALNAKGVGLMDVGARFPAPAMEGDVMTLDMSVAEWGSKTLKLAYEGCVGDRSVVVGSELRGCFVVQDGRMRAGPMAPLRQVLNL